MLKVLDYSKVYGTQDRDDTILVVKLAPHDSHHSQQVGNPVVVNQSNREHFEAKDMVVVQMPNNPGHSGSEESPKVITV